MVRFTRQALPWHADRPAVALYDAFASDGRLPDALRADAAAASSAVVCDRSGTRGEHRLPALWRRRLPRCRRADGALPGHARANRRVGAGDPRDRQRLLPRRWGEPGRTRRRLRSRTDRGDNPWRVEQRGRRPIRSGGTGLHERPRLFNRPPSRFAHGVRRGRRHVAGPKTPSVARSELDNRPRGWFDRDDQVDATDDYPARASARALGTDVHRRRHRSRKQTCAETRSSINASPRTRGVP